jgi:predicted O-methyltransferase YrrM
MSLLVAAKDKTKTFAKTVFHFGNTYYERFTRDTRNTDMFLKSTLPNLPLLNLNEPIDFVNNLRECIKPMNFKLRWVKGRKENYDNLEIKRFNNLIDVLHTEVPPMRFQDAVSHALVVDKYLGNYSTCEADTKYCGDVALHWKISSSRSRMGRLLSSIVRIMRPITCLEVGTAYGISSLYILFALDHNQEGGRLITLEGIESTFKLARETLTEKFKDKVICKQGMTQDKLADLVGSLKNIDFMFHDAGHSYKDYVEDFSTAEPYLSPGAVLLFDDIRWYDPRFTVESPNSAYEGWIEVTKHKRVIEAIEVDKYAGLILLR